MTMTFDEKVTAYSAVVNRKAGRVLDQSLMSEIAAECSALDFELTILDTDPLVIEVTDRDGNTATIGWARWLLVPEPRRLRVPDYLSITREVS